MGKTKAERDEWKRKAEEAEADLMRLRVKYAATHDCKEKAWEEVDRLTTEVGRFKAAIREHKDQRGDDRCWLDDSKLYSVLDDRCYDSSLPPKCEFLESCARFWEQRQHPGAEDRRAGEMTIAQLQAEVERLRALTPA